MRNHQSAQLLEFPISSRRGGGSWHRVRIHAELEREVGIYMDRRRIRSQHRVDKHGPCWCKLPVRRIATVTPTSARCRAVVQTIAAEGFRRGIALTVPRTAKK